MTGLADLALAMRQAASHGNRGHKPPAPTRTYAEDPTVAATAADVSADLWARIGRKVEGGAWFYRAREEVLAEEIPDISKAYGRPVASRVEKAIQQMDPARISPAARDAVRAGNRAAVQGYLRGRSRRGRISLVNRVSLALFGRHFW